MRHPADFAPSAPWSRMFIGGWSSRNKEVQKSNEIAAERHLKSQNLSPGELLALNPRNFQISNNDITLVELKKGVPSLYYLKFHRIVSERKLSRDFTIHKDQAPEIRQLLVKVFPAKFKAE